MRIHVHQGVPATRFNNIFLKLFDRYATYCYIQVDLKSFLASGAFFFRPRSDRASYDFASNKFQAFQLFDRKSRNQTSQSPGWATQTIFSLSPEAKSCAVRLLYAVSLLSPSLLTQYLFSACAIQPYKRLMGMCRLMGSHFHDWIDYNGVAFSKELLEWGRTFSDFWGKRVVHIYGQQTYQDICTVGEK